MHPYYTLSILRCSLALSLGIYLLPVLRLRVMERPDFNCFWQQINNMTYSMFISLHGRQQ